MVPFSLGLYVFLSHFAIVHPHVVEIFVILIVLFPVFLNLNSNVYVFESSEISSSIICVLKDKCAYAFNIEKIPTKMERHICFFIW